jgi:glutathione-regulated potassium-efflux system ancillary protein KefG
MPEQHNRVLILFAHPSRERSEVNIPLYQASSGNDAVTLVDLYGEYPDYRIDIDREQQRLRDHDMIVFMFPLYWYSTPSILKEWQDLVLEYGFAYGSEGNALHGKTFLCALTAGGAAKAYKSDGYNHFTIRQLLQPLEQMADLTGMLYLPPFALFGSRTAVDEDRVDAHVADWERLLLALVEGRIEAAQAMEMQTLNEDLSRVIRSAR